MRYYLEIYMPGSAREVMQSFESDSPFGSIQAGDLLSTMGLMERSAPGDALVVAKIEHMIWQVPPNPLSHKLCVYTKETYGDSEGIRRG